MENEKQNLGQNVESMGVGLPPKVMSHEEKKEELVKSLHKNELLPNLRTYHGDIAEFIKSKDQSLTSITLKEQQKKQERKKEEQGKQERQKESEVEKKEIIYQNQDKSKEKIGENFLIYIIGIFLILGAIVTASYLLIFKGKQGPVSVVTEKTIIPVKKTVAIDSSVLTMKILQEDFSSLRKSSDYKNGITGVIIVDSNKKVAITTSDFLNTLEWHMPSALRRTLGDEFMLGLYLSASTLLPKQNDFFMILKIKDYGVAFRDMLEWERNMVTDLEPLLKVYNTSTSTQFIFKDLIVKNKDTRAALSTKGEVRLIYSFLNKETILITESESAIKDILDAFLTRSTVR